MTKKHYIMLAKALAEARHIACTHDALDYLADALATAMKQDNANFDRARFLSAASACEYSED